MRTLILILLFLPGIAQRTEWVQAYPSDGLYGVSGIIHDRQGNTLIYGDGITGRDLFGYMVKVDASGSRIWSKKDFGVVSIVSTAVDNNGNIFSCISPKDT